MKRVNFSERVLAFGVALTMMLGVSVPVLATEGETLNEKIADATDGAVITLDKDYTEDVEMSLALRKTFKEKVYDAVVKPLASLFKWKKKAKN